MLFPFRTLITQWTLKTLHCVPSFLFFCVSLLLRLFSYLHSISGRVQCASLGQVRGREEEQRSAEQHRAQHGGDDRQQGQAGVEQAPAAKRKITMFYTQMQHKMKFYVNLKFFFPFFLIFLYYIKKIISLAFQELFKYKLISGTPSFFFRLKFSAELNHGTLRACSRDCNSIYP